tara:strand:- start:129753 stop:129917 length:165 start_codon:yes stop_codon:yes gene_type:complete
VCRGEILTECQNLFAADEVKPDKSAAFLFMSATLLLKNERLLAVWGNCSHNPVE